MSDPIELHDKKVVLEFTVERTIETRTKATFVTEIPEVTYRFLYKNIQPLLEMIVENVAPSELGWITTGEGHPQYRIVATKEVEKREHTS